MRLFDILSKKAVEISRSVVRRDSSGLIIALN